MLTLFRFAREGVEWCEAAFKTPLIGRESMRANQPRAKKPKVDKIKKGKKEK
jgi:hypothetical protein